MKKTPPYGVVVYDPHIKGSFFKWGHFIEYQHHTFPSVFSVYSHFIQILLRKPGIFPRFRNNLLDKYVTICYNPITFCTGGTFHG